MFNYSDNLIYTGLPSDIYAADDRLITLPKELSLAINAKKLVAPYTKVVGLGIEIDSVDRTISVPKDKAVDIISISKVWINKTS